MRNEAKKSWLVSSFLIGGLIAVSFYNGYAQRVLDVTSSIIIYPALCFRSFFIEPVAHWMSDNRDISQLKSALAQECAHKELLLARIVIEQATKNYAADVAEIINFKSRYNFENAQTAQVLSRTFSENEQSLLINVGARNGIKEDMLALSNNMLIGKIVNVYPWYCRVQLITDKSCKVASYCARTKVHGVHIGTGDADCSALEHVSHLQKIDVEDLIISSGKGLVFPQGFVLGKVAAVQTQALQHRVQIKPLCDFATLGYCLVVDRESC